MFSKSGAGGSPALWPRAGHQFASSGNKFLNLTLARGSAIMGATASRQVW
jgi:hypothetical protein